MARSDPPRPPVRVFAVEDTSVQLTWAGLPARSAVLGVGPAAAAVEAGPPAWVHRRGRSSRRCNSLPGGPGSVVLGGLAPATSYELWWRPAGGRRQSLGRVATLAPPPGRLLARIATISDLHLGERHFGLLGTILDVHPPSARLEGYTWRAASAALDEAAVWGATTLVVKGDITARGSAVQFGSAAALLRRTPMTPLVQLGNHDVVHPADLAALLPGVAVAHHGRPLVHDIPGARLVLADSPVRGRRRGRLDAAQVEEIAAALAGAPGAALLFSHHPPQPWPLPASYPPGLYYRDSRRLVGAVRAANPATVILAGHTHRNRSYAVGGVPVVEVGSTKDYPGGWAGYAVHEGGIRQVVRRTARPDVLAWTEATAEAVAGLWGRWSPGRLSDRCWSRTWPER